MPIVASVANGEQLSERPPIIVHDLARTLFVGEDTWPEHVSFVFVIEPTSDRPLELRITAQGLGAVRFAKLEIDQELQCPMESGLGVLKVPVLPDKRVRVGGCIPTEHLPFPGNMQDGHLLLLSADHGSLEVPLTLMRHAKPTSILFSGVLWFLSIFIPAALAGGMGLFFWKRRQRFTRLDEQKYDFEEFKVKEYQEMKSYFETNYWVIRQKAEAEFADQLYHDLEYKGWLLPIPTKERSGLLDALKEQTTVPIVEALAGIFWENKKSIRRQPN